MNMKAVVLAKRLLKLNAKPYNDETCDHDCTVFEEVAVSLAHAVTAKPEWNPQATATQLRAIAESIVTQEPRKDSVAALIRLADELEQQETKGCDCDQRGNPDVAMHAHDCEWRVRVETKYTKGAKAGLAGA